MLKVTGLYELQRELDELQQTLSGLDQNLGKVSFDPNDPSSIESAIQSMNQMIDKKLVQYESNLIIKQLSEKMKEVYRKEILNEAAKVRYLTKEGD